MERTRIVIMGAAGRDFHNFNVAYRDDPSVEVVAFTAAQIPGIDARSYPPELAGPAYPDGIPILPESRLEEVCAEHSVQRVVFAYSDISHEQAMHQASRCLAAGADFLVLGPRSTQLVSRHPVIAVTAIRTGCGKSQTARYIARWLRERGYRPAVIRHPMPYGLLARQAVQRFASAADLDVAACTNEEREEYEPHIAMGGVVFAGADTAAVLARAESESDLIIWDGGNNDFSFLRPDLHIVLADALRPGQAARYHPGEAVARRADVLVLNKIDSAAAGDIETVLGELRRLNPTAPIVRAASPVVADRPEAIEGHQVLVIEDGPTVTHGGRPHGAGLVAAQHYGAAEVVDPRGFAVPAIVELYRSYPHLGPVLPAVGYSDQQRQALSQTIAASPAETVLIATPMDLSGLVPADKTAVRVRYDYADAGEPRLATFLERFCADHRKATGAG